MQKRDHFWLLRHHYSESPIIPLSNDIWYRCVAHGFITLYFLIFYRWSIVWGQLILLINLIIIEPKFRNEWRQFTSKWPFLDGNGIFQCKWLVFASLKQWPWPKIIPIYVIMTFIYVSLYETCIFNGFKRSKCLKGCFYLWMTLIKKNFKGSHEMYNARSYLGTDKIQTYKNTCVVLFLWFA
jgi:hypothetical protein